MMSSALLIIVPALYVSALFAFAWWAEGAGGRATARRWRLPAYTLALAVYCTSWTFFGAVGSAASQGWPYLPIYLGPILVFLFGIRFLERLVRTAHEEGATSIADFIGARFGRSRGVAALVAILALLGTIPYVALQLRSVGTSFAHLSGGGETLLPTLGTAVLLGAFALLFGTRRYEAASRSDGVVLAIGIESLVKLLAFAAVAAFAAWMFVGAALPVRQAGMNAVAANFAIDGINGDFVVITLLAAAAIICLPRQFHLTVTEASSPSDVIRARWPFIAYLALTALLVLPITLAGMAGGITGTNPDLLVLGLPLDSGAQWLAIIAFVGGFSAATGMVVVECIALATMVSNDLLGPLLLRSRRWANAVNFGERLLWLRRGVIVALVAVAFAYARATPPQEQLAAIGLTAFAAMIQFAPALVLAVRRGGRDPLPAKAGLATGLILWVLLLFLPAITGVRLIDLDGFLGLGGVAQGAAVSLGANMAVHAIFALAPHRWRSAPVALAAGSSGAITFLPDLVRFTARFVGADRAGELGQGAGPVTRSSARAAERMIADVVGAPSARALVASALSGSQLSADQVARMLDETGQSLQFSKGLLASTLEHIDPAVSVVDRDLRLAAWNSRYLELFDYPPGMVAVGTPVADLIRYNALRGECGPGEVEDHVARRIANMRRSERHSFERVRPDGRVLKTVGGPMPGGGYVMCFTDITAEAEARAALEAARAQLEQRVSERTAELTRANWALAEATADKTRFLAAASHDLLQPLHAARLFLSALDGRVEQAAMPLLAKAGQSIDGGEQLLRALLDISRIDAGGITPRSEHVDLGALVRDMVETMRPLAAEKGLSLRFAGSSAWAESDPALLRSIVQNLMSNAIRYTARGGVIAGVRRRGGQARVEVWDSGPGIAHDKQRLIFREFERLDTGSEAGLGLGLAIVERTARLLGADIALTSWPGKGSRFALALPLAVDGGHGLSETLSRGADAPARSVLVVDDDPAVVEATVALLTSWGHSVTATGSVEQALGLHGRFDAALLDFDLGEGMDGLELAALLRARGRAGRFALVTASTDAVIAGRADKMGITVLSKPVDVARLAAWLAGAPSREAAE